jgi:hypothetical protein
LPLSPSARHLAATHAARVADATLRLAARFSMIDAATFSPDFFAYIFLHC